MAFTNLSERWFRILLRMYPQDFRDEMGEALVEAYLYRSREESLVVVWIAALWDSLRNGLGERLRPAVAWRRGGDWGRDMGLVTRRLRQQPLFFLAAMGTLTAGLGAFAVVFTAVDKILLEPLPYENPQDLYAVFQKVNKFALTGPHAAALQTAGGLIEGAAIYRFGLLTIPAGPQTDAFNIVPMNVSPNMFDVLRVRPALGRGFRPDETGPNAPNVIVLSDDLWKRLGGSPGIVGTEIRINSTRFTVIGVMAPDFRFGGSATEVPDAYVPLRDDLARQPDPFLGNWQAVIRARHGASIEQIGAAVNAAGRSVDEVHNKGKNRELIVVGLHQDLVNDVRPALLALAFAAGFLLLVLTVNLASLLLARAAEREREFAISRALGASGRAVVRATLLEGGVLGLSGGAAASLAGIWGTRLLVALGPIELPRRETIAMDWSVAVIVIGVGVLLGLVAAGMPAVWASRVSLASFMTGLATRGGAGSSRMRRSMIVVQVALSLVLLSAGGLVVRSFQHLLAADPGFGSKGILSFGVGYDKSLFPQGTDFNTFQDRVETALRALPGVTSVSATSMLPLSGGGNVCWVALPDEPKETGPGQAKGRPCFRIFTRPGYLETMGMRLVAGRTLEERRHDEVHETVIDRRTARHFFGSGNPLGRMLVFDHTPVTIVGVVEQARLVDLYKDDEFLHLYLRGEGFSDQSWNRPWRYVVRTDRDPKSLITEIRDAIRQIDRRVPVSYTITMDEMIAEARSRERISAVLIGGLAAGALVLVSMGLFGMISGSVARRRGELAVRLALGATHQCVIRLVVSEGARLVVAGMLIGIPGIYMAGEALRGFLIGVSPFDASTLLAVAIGFAAVALLACYLAARRVTAIDPERLLREGG
jgi:putative ABC transport system permease protein